MAKIVITSDWHLKPFAKSKFKSQKWSLVEWFISWFGGCRRGSDFLLGLICFVQRENVHNLIMNGDFQENTFNERGLSIDIDVDHMKGFLETFEERGEIKVRINAGNHELGYNLPLSSDNQAGISEKSVQNFLTIVGRERLFYTFLIDGKRFIFIPYLFSENIEAEWFLRIKADFIEELEIAIQGSSEPIVLIFHDFDSLNDSKLSSMIETCHQKGGVEKVFCGHNHARWGFVVNQLLIRLSSSKWTIPFYVIFSPLLMLIGRVLHKDWMLFEKIRKYYNGKRSVLKWAKKLKPIVIPAPNGLFGFGGGILIYDTETGEVILEKI